MTSKEKLYWWRRLLSNSKLSSILPKKVRAYYDKIIDEKFEKIKQRPPFDSLNKGDRVYGISVLLPHIVAPNENEDKTMLNVMKISGGNFHSIDIFNKKKFAINWFDVAEKTWGAALIDSPLAQLKMSVCRYARTELNNDEVSQFPVWITTNKTDAIEIINTFLNGMVKCTIDGCKQLDDTKDTEKRIRILKKAVRNERHRLIKELLDLDNIWLIS